MEIRKIQKTGGSSFVVTLPKKWINALGLKKNDGVFVHVQPDSSLLILPQNKKNQLEKLKKTLFVSEETTSYLERELIGAYVMGYEIIEVQTSRFITQDIRKVVRDFTTKVMGFEIVDESVDKITLKDIMNPTELPFDRAIKRMFNIVKSMHKNMLFALENFNKDMALNVISMDFEVNKLYWVVFRHLNALLKNPAALITPAEEKISYKSALNYFLVSRILERIGDHVGRVCKAILDLPKEKIPTETIQELRSLSKKNFSTLEECMGTLFTKDIMLLNKVFVSVDKLKPDFQEMRNIIQSREAVYGLQLGEMLESIRRIGEYAKDIAEYMINYIIDQELYPNQKGANKNKN